MSDREMMIDIIEKVFIRFKHNIESGDENFSEAEGQIVVAGLERIVRPILERDEISIRDVRAELEKRHDSAPVSAFTMILCSMMDQPLTAMGSRRL